MNGGNRVETIIIGTLAGLVAYVLTGGLKFAFEALF